MNELPKTGFVRIWQILGDSKANPEIPALIPIARSTWWAGCNSGRYPRPIKLSPGVTVWLAEDIRRLISDIADRKCQMPDERPDGGGS